jgi:hypothetical protein
MFRKSSSSGDEEEEESSTSSKRVEQDLARYALLTDKLLALLCGIFPDRAGRGRVRMVIESYAFYGRGHTGNNYKLHEVTGCFKLRLFMVGFTNWTEQPVSVWRKVCFGSPRAEKKDAFEFFCGRMPGVDLLNICKRKLGKNGNVPCPVQDICEAYCISWSVLNSPGGDRKTKRKETKKTRGRKKRRADQKGRDSVTPPAKKPKTDRK